MRELVIDLAAVERNYQVMKARASGALAMAVVKANGYGHGMIEVAKRLDGKVDYFGVADLDEALQLRAAGIEAPILAWLHSPHEDFEAAIDTDIELGLSTVDHLNRAAEAATAARGKARVHLKVDTGLGRNGAAAIDWPQVVTTAKALAEMNLIEVVAVFSHLSSTSEADDLAQIKRFEDSVALARDLGLDFKLRHLTASDGTLSYPQAHYEMVRIGVALYGLSPFVDHSSSDYGITPAMTARSVVVQTKRVAADEGISYGYLHRTKGETTVALVPVGYAEGLPRSATGRAEVLVAGKRYPILARIAMDQFVIDVGDDAVVAGDPVVIFGNGSDGAPTADDLARADDTINYEIVTRMGGRFVRKYVG